MAHDLRVAGRKFYAEPAELTRHAAIGEATLRRLAKDL